MIRYAITAGDHGIFLKRDRDPCLTRMRDPRDLDACNAVEDCGSLLPFPPEETLLDQVRRLARSGVDFIQLREKHLPARELAALARQVLSLLAESAARNRTQTRLMINSRADVAAAVGAHGVHLSASPGSLTPSQVRRLYRSIGRSARLPPPTVSMACHSLPEIRVAQSQRPDLILFSPVFGKGVHGATVVRPAGLEALAAACALAHPIPVLGLGGVTPENCGACLHAGAAGIAGIRLFAAASQPSPVA